MDRARPIRLFKCTVARQQKRDAEASLFCQVATMKSTLPTICNLLVFPHAAFQFQQFLLVLERLDQTLFFSFVDVNE